MGISRHGKIFWLDIRIKGKRIRRSLETEKRNEALARYAPLREKLLEKHLGEKVRFLAFCEQYIEWGWGAKPLSMQRETQRLRKIQDFFQGLEIVYLEDITPYHLERLKAEFKGRGLSKTTVNMYLQILRGMFYKAIDWEVYNKPNPLKKVRFFKRETPVQALSKEGMSKVLKAARIISDSPRSQVQRLFYDLVIFALNTGMRKSEILNLKWQDIKDDELSVKGKGDKRRTVPLNRAALEIIGSQPMRSEWVFDILNRHQPNVLWRAVERIRKMTGTDFHFHLLRHAFTTSLVERGVDFITIQELLGHSRLTMSLIYSHTDSERKKKAVEKLDIN
ncbi:Tyrosine recombinase XerC [subsurface metagenome]|nr:tyrosine-type recombinase/integrase [bacterium]